MVNAGGQQVGHIPRAVAGKIAPLMDASRISVEGRMVGQILDGRNHYTLAAEILLFGRPSDRGVLEPQLAWATPDQRGFEYMRALQRTGQAGLSTPRTKGKGHVLGTGLNEAGGVGAGDVEMRRLLDGLRRVGEDEKLVAGVMVSQDQL